MPILTGDPNLQVITINDFTPGIFVNRGATFSTTAPLGSASSAFRCIAYAGVGLVPFPTYTTIGSVTQTVGANGWVSTGAMKALGQKASGFISSLTVPFNEALVFSTLASNISGSVGLQFDIWAAETLPALATPFAYTGNGGLYDSTIGGFPQGPLTWPNMDTMSFTTAGVPTKAVITIDPLQSGSAVKWVTVPGTNGSFTISAGTFTPVSTFSRAAHVFSHTSRACFIPFAQDTYFSSSLVDAYTLYTSDIQAMTNITGPEFFYPEMGQTLAVWGSVSAGELFLLYANDGGVLVYGDPQFPSAAVKLPGVLGPGAVSGPAVQTSLGLIYPTHNGARVWNGGSASDEISRQVEGVNLARTQPLFNGQALGIPFNLSLTAHDVWGNWVMFANNWVFDLLTQSWWQMDAPAFQHTVFTKSLVSDQYFYSSDGLTLIGNITPPANIGVHFRLWDSTILAGTYTWVSNPLPATGSIVNLQAVEICASNPTATAATVTVTPTSPGGDAPFPNQTPAQPVVFNIPANTAGFRAMKRVGYRDYNVCVQVVSTNSNLGNPAPTLHEISCGILTESSGTNQ